MMDRAREDDLPPARAYFVIHPSELARLREECEAMGIPFDEELYIAPEITTVSGAAER